MNMLGTTRDDILDAFKQLSNQWVGLRVAEAAIVGGSLRFRWQGNGRLGVVVGDFCLRDARPAEYAELEDAVDLGQAQIYLTQLDVCGRRFAPKVVHQATGQPLDENSPAAIAQRRRWAEAELLPQKGGSRDLVRVQLGQTSEQNG